MLAKRIIEHAEGLGEGAVLTARGLLHLGERYAVDQALSRLARAGTLMRVSRGRYVLPVASRFGALPPEPSKVIAHIEEETSEPVLPHGIAAANALGLTTQVPVRRIYVTAGRSQELRFGKSIVQIKHVPRWQTLMPHRQAGAAIRALAWLGREHAPEALQKLSRSLPEKEWLALTAARPQMPTWMAQAVSEASRG